MSWSVRLVPKKPGKHLLQFLNRSQLTYSASLCSKPSDMEPDTKKAKVESNSRQAENGQDQPIVGDLSEFEFVRVLANYSQKKVVCVEGRLKNKEGKACLWLDKTPFSAEVVKSMCTENSKLTHEFQNDIFGSYSTLTEPTLNEIKTTLVYPATEQHIRKFLEKPRYVVEETPDCYNNVTLPFITKEQLSFEWIYNVLDGKKESDRLIYEDKDPSVGFSLIFDLKWDGKQMENFYCLALVRPRGIKSIRDLTPEHIPLLKNVLNKGREAIEEKYGIGKEKLRVYLHYQPSFYHLHVHFNVIEFEDSGTKCEKAHLLRSVIDNLEKYPNYYQTAVLTCIVSEGENLCQEFFEKGIIKKVEPAP